jgi:hypothetical protein
MRGPCDGQYDPFSHRRCADYYRGRRLVRPRALVLREPVRHSEAPTTMVRECPVARLNSSDGKPRPSIPAPPAKAAATERWNLAARQPHRSPRKPVDSRSGSPPWGQRQRRPIHGESALSITVTVHSINALRFGPNLERPSVTAPRDEDRVGRTTTRARHSNFGNPSR